MASDILISAENLSKSYRLWNSSSGRLWVHLLEGVAFALPTKWKLRRKLMQLASNAYREFRALDKLSLTVRQGESIGIIGRNGSGKSTVLQLIAGTLAPTTGTVQINGRVAALLELGSGFNPDFTGRENVYLNAAVLGLPRTEIAKRFDSIEKFADIGDFMDQPVKTYSSGMQVRLAFAVAIAVDPQILIVDEALSVGDVFFQQKCFDRIRELLEGGTTLFLVSHDLAAVQNLCSRAYLLDRGRLVYEGQPEECVSRYYAKILGDSPTAPQALPTPSDILQDNLLANARTRHGSRRLELLAARLSDADGETTMQVEMGGCLHIEVLLRANEVVAVPACGVHLFDRMNNLVFGAGNPQLKLDLPALKAGETILLRFRLRFSVQPGPYTFNLALAEPDSHNANLADFYDVCEGLGPIDVLPPTSGVWPFYGIAQLEMKIEVLHV